MKKRICFWSEEEVDEFADRYSRAILDEKPVEAMDAAIEFFERARLADQLAFVMAIRALKGRQERMFAKLGTKASGEAERQRPSPRLRFEILKRDGFTCQYCGRKAPEVKLHVDHIHPLSLGGSNEPENLLTACDKCNLGKADKRLAKDNTSSPSIASEVTLGERQEEKQDIHPKPSQAQGSDVLL